MIIIENNFCDKSYLEKINNFIKKNKNKFIVNTDDEYKNIFNENKNINNAFLYYKHVHFHLNFLKTKYPILNKINFDNFEINCVINKLTQGSHLRVHKDATMYTHILYLNEEFTGGELLLLGNKKLNEDKRPVIMTIQPEKNLSILMSENHFHKVNAVLNGERYTLTTFIREKNNYNSNNIKNLL
jgi:Rps23 Pro-64 3,4-dihydroxylase Tpa1-like proline 4-hydroxylase